MVRAADSRLRFASSRASYLLLQWSPGAPCISGSSNAGSDVWSELLTARLRMSTPWRSAAYSSLRLYARAIGCGRLASGAAPGDDLVEEDRANAQSDAQGLRFGDVTMGEQF